ncbi:GNAT family N-acetyltransferase [Streptomyces sp. MST-110588]|uniref:GNAT family N-acetyltransferase n=1 Tax=Streptomyces sp. MST-110588 TaxID=2833628 RepID=UPI001F5D3099|nr:GNAT family N-acetyltransferase [Streptomyces sp. MST-110588]UNO40634.1 GNAT family N-acetyltransferase [Streptomyces sp. MST-110588]
MSAQPEPALTALEVRPFHRDDRDQLTDLINAHVAAVVPGVSVSVNTVLSQLQRQPDEFIVDPWVAERLTLVAGHRHGVVAAAHLLRYRTDAAVGECYRGAGGIEWFVCHPPASFRPGAREAADLLMSACLAQFVRWKVTSRYADGALPAPGVYGLPEPWPHIRAAYERAGFVHDGDTEIVLIADVADLPPRPAGPSDPAGLSVRRTLGECGTRFTAHPPPTAGRDTRIAGFIEVDTVLDRAERRPRGGGLADIGNLHVAEEYRDTGLTTWLLGHAAHWLRLAGSDRLLAYASPDESDRIRELTAHGFCELTRTARGWHHRP